MKGTHPEDELTHQARYYFSRLNFADKLVFRQVPGVGFNERWELGVWVGRQASKIILTKREYVFRAVGRGESREAALTDARERLHNTIQAAKRSVSAKREAERNVLVGSGVLG